MNVNVYEPTAEQLAAWKSRTLSSAESSKLESPEFESDELKATPIARPLAADELADLITNPEIVISSLKEERFPYDAVEFLARQSLLIYDPEQDVTSCLDGKAYEHIKWFESDDTQAVGFVSQDHCFIVFRGTEPTNPCDWWTSLKILACGQPRRHRGYHNAWEAIGEEVIQWLEGVPEDRRTLVLSGHSLGGALAIMSAFDLSDQYPVRAVITFGAPRVGGAKFRRMYDQKPCGSGSSDQRRLGQVTWRLVHGTDFASQWPPAILMYRHVGNEVFLSSRGLIAMSGRLDTAFQRGLTRVESVLSGIPSPTALQVDFAPHVLGGDGVIRLKASNVLSFGAFLVLSQTGLGLIPAAAFALAASFVKDFESHALKKYIRLLPYNANLPGLGPKIVVHCDDEPGISKPP